MIIYPAIDIRAGRSVRLIEGDYDQETVFDADPTDAARRWVDQGAEWLHVVDLDGARQGSPGNLQTIKKIREAVAVPIQVGGGIRNASSATELISLGIDRIILGTVALTAPELVKQLTADFPGKVAVGLDGRDGMVSTNGWFDQSEVSIFELASRMQAFGVSDFIVTDIRRDGKLVGPDVEGITAMVDTFGPGIICSGGVGTLDDVRAVAAAGATGLIIGRALYDGRVDLAEAIQIGSLSQGSQ